MTDFSGIVFALSIAAAIVLTIILIIRHAKKRSIKKLGISIGVCLVVAVLMVIVGVETIPDDSDTVSNTKMQTEQSIQEKKATQSKSNAQLEKDNAQLKKDATKADFIQLNGHEDEYEGKKVYIEGIVSTVTKEGAPGGEFTVSVQEGNGYGDYGITSLDTEHNYNIGKDIVKGSKVKLYGIIKGKDNVGAPHIIAIIVEKE